jgi:hypothetical protein
MLEYLRWRKIALACARKNFVSISTDLYQNDFPYHLLTLVEFCLVSYPESGRSLVDEHLCHKRDKTTSRYVLFAQTLDADSTLWEATTQQ